MENLNLELQIIQSVLSKAQLDVSLCFTSVDPSISKYVRLSVVDSHNKLAAPL